jgi:multidrug efflux pump subunit AcrB
MSSITIELHNDANTRDVLTDIKDSVDKVDLPEDAEDSNVVEISSSNELMYEVLLY